MRYADFLTLHPAVAGQEINTALQIAECML
jgi:hypothetical protein